MKLVKGIHIHISPHIIPKNLYKSNKWKLDNYDYEHMVSARWQIQIDNHRTRIG